MKKETKIKAMKLVAKQAELFEEVQLLRLNEDIMGDVVELSPMKRMMYAKALNELCDHVVNVCVALCLNEEDLAEAVKDVSAKYKEQKEAKQQAAREFKDKLIAKHKSKDEDIVDIIKEMAEKAGKDVTIVKVSSKDGK